MQFYGTAKHYFSVLSLSFPQYLRETFCKNAKLPWKPSMWLRQPPPPAPSSQDNSLTPLVFECLESWWWDWVGVNFIPLPDVSCFHA